MTTIKQLLKTALVCLETVKGELKNERDLADLSLLIQKIDSLLKAERTKGEVKSAKFSSEIQKLTKIIDAIKWSEIDKPIPPHK